MQTTSTRPTRGPALERQAATITALPNTVDALAALKLEQLEPLYASAGWSAADLEAVAGHPRGRVLAVAGLDARVPGALVRGVHASALYPWEGKSFATTSATEGRGINRFRYPARGGLGQFRTSIASSVMDGRPCLAIDYNVPENVLLLRGIYDELRSLGNGLYLGRGMHRAGSRRPALLLWFAVDTRVQDRPVAITTG